ncbi:MAG: hypothetical protein IJ180_04095 [Bacteroidales bacterium]|nr:hypothetical protein [Bacteroidales bacterium]
MKWYKYFLLFVLVLFLMQVDVSAQPERPSRHGRTDDEPISGPVGSGTLLMLGLGATYLAYNIRKNNKSHRKDNEKE